MTPADLDRLRTRLRSEPLGLRWVGRAARELAAEVTRLQGDLVRANTEIARLKGEVVIR